jgi:hypothetical protein
MSPGDLCPRQSFLAFGQHPHRTNTAPEVFWLVVSTSTSEPSTRERR